MAADLVAFGVHALVWVSYVSGLVLAVVRDGMGL